MKRQNYERPNDIFTEHRPSCEREDQKTRFHLFGTHLKKGKYIACIALILIMALAVISCGKQPGGIQKSKTIKVQEYITIEYSPAYNKYATPELVVDTEGLNALIGSQKVIDYYKALMDYDEEYAEIYEGFIEMLEEDPESILPFTDFFDVEFSEEYTNLKNGDTVKVHIILGDMFYDVSLKEVTEKMGIKFDKIEMEFKVKGLEDFKTAKLDLNKLFQVNFGKYNGYATPSVEIDYDYFENFIVQDVINDFYRQCNNWEVKDVLSDDCSEWFYAEFDQSYNNLKNGDTIKVNIVLNDAFTEHGFSLEDFETGIRVDLDNGTNTYLVEGLVEPQNVIDIFEGIEQFVVYEGANGYGYIRYPDVKIPNNYTRQIGDIYFYKAAINSVKIIYQNTNIGELSYFIDDSNDTKLSGGHVIKLYAQEYGYNNLFKTLEDLGYIVPSKSKNVTVPDLGEYLRTQDQLTPEIIATIKEQICEKAEVSSLEKLYLTTFKPGIECKYNSIAFIVGIYHKSGFWSSGYYIDELYNVIIKSDGTVTIEDYEEDSSWGGSDTLDEAIGQLDKNAYEFVVIE